MAGISNPFCWCAAGSAGSRVELAFMGGDLKDRAHCRIPELGFGAVVDKFGMGRAGVWGEMEMDEAGVSLGWVDI